MSRSVAERADAAWVPRRVSPWPRWVRALGWTAAALLVAMGVVAALVEAHGAGRWLGSRPDEIRPGLLHLAMAWAWLVLLGSCMETILDAEASG